MDLSKHLQKAEEASRRRNYGLAIGLFQQILDLDPDSGEARLGLREALDKKFEGKKGGGVLARVQGFLPLLSSGIAKMTKGHASRARNLERYLALAPHDVGANLALGESLYKAGHPKSAYVVYRHLAERLSKAGKTGPNAQQAGAAWRAAAGVAQELQKLDEAMECLEGALQLNPRDQDAIRARKNLSAVGQLEGAGFATATSSRELMKDKDQQKSLEKAQRIHKSADEIAEDLAGVEKRLAEAPDDLDVLRQVGELRARAGDLGGGLDCLERVLKATPDDVSLHSRVDQLRIAEIEKDLAKACKLGDDAKAARLDKKIAGIRRDDVQRRVAAHPTDLALRRELAELLLGAGDVDSAIAEFQKAVKDPRQKLDSLVGLGAAFRKKGMLDLAQGQLEKALEAVGTGHPRALDLLYELGCVAEDRGNSDDARGFFSRIVEVDIGFKDVSKKLETLNK